MTKLFFLALCVVSIRAETRVTADGGGNQSTVGDCNSEPEICPDDGIFCNGPGACLLTGICGQAGNPCSALQYCDEDANSCQLFDACLTHRNSDFTVSQGSGPFFPQCTNQNCNTSPTGDYSYGDDIELAKHSSRLVTSYGFRASARANAAIGAGCDNNGAGPINPGILGDPFVVNAALFTVEPGTCLPGKLIQGSQCSFGPACICVDSGTAHVNCELATPVLVPDGTNVEECTGGSNDGFPCSSDADCTGGGSCEEGPTSQCGIDFFIMMNADKDGAGPTIGCTTQIGGPGIADELGTDAMIFATCTSGGVWSGWRFAYTGPGSGCPVNRGNFRGEFVCTVPTGACCNAIAGTCSVQTQDDCDAAGGTYLSEIQIDGSGGCDDGMDTDGDGSRDECDLCDNDSAKTASGQCGCGNPDTDGDGDMTADCIDGCPDDPQKSFPGICGCGSSDIDGDSDDMADCHDLCPTDPNKILSEKCGCGNVETGDSDGDAVADCVDECTGANDSIYAPGCISAIPAATEWGLVVITLALLSLSKIYFRRIGVA